jgi:primosomal protein N' (replication factor Y)
LESWVNARKGKYLGVDLKWRYGGATLPTITAIDMRSESLSSGKWISPTLLSKIKEKLEKGEQTLLFLNRRGYAPVTICRSCGEQISCDQCDSRMVQHRFVERLICHQCGKTSRIPNKCNSCNSDDTLSVVGPGIERLAEEVTKLFPTARVGVLSSDLFTTPMSLRKQLSEIESGKIDIIVGTQLVAKGHNFPELTLVGVIDADLGLQGADLRAAERTFQLINQVSGRAGRQNKPGETLIQTYDPEHRVIKAILEADLEKFWSLEANDREKAGVPPFGRFVGIILSGVSLKNVEDTGKILFQNSTNLRNLGVQVFGPAPAPFSRIKGKYRQRLLVKAEQKFPIQRFLKDWILTVKSRKGVRIQIDIDPYNFL